MGVTIHYRLAQRREHVKNALDVAQEISKQIMENQARPMGIDFQIIRESDFCLLINIGGCETLAFDFNSLEDYERIKGWSYEKATVIESGLAKLEDSDVLWTSKFCKTQFASNIIEHKWVADIIKVVASHCRIAVVGDEADYYHSGNLGDAVKNIGENGRLIDSVSKTLGGLGFDQVVKGETKIGKIKK